MQTPRPESPTPSYGARAFARQRNPPLKRRRKLCEVLSRNNPGSLGQSARVPGVSDLILPPPAAPFRGLSKRGRGLGCHPPHPLGNPQRRLVVGGEGAGRYAGAPHVGAKARRRAPGESECQKRKKAEVFLQISRQPRRVSGRARDFQRARRPRLSGGPGIPSQSPESPRPEPFPGCAGGL